MQSYSDRIKRARSALGLSQQAAATKWGVSQQCLSAWERGKVQPKGLYRALLDHILHDSETTNPNFTQFTKRTNYPKLGYLIYRLKEAGVACRLNGESWHAPILDVDESKIDIANALLNERRGRYTLDDVRDDHPRFLPYEHETPH